MMISGGEKFKIPLPVLAALSLFAFSRELSAVDVRAIAASQIHSAAVSGTFCRDALTDSIPSTGFSLAERIAAMRQSQGLSSSEASSKGSWLPMIAKVRVQINDAMPRPAVNYPLIDAKEAELGSRPTLEATRIKIRNAIELVCSGCLEDANSKVPLEVRQVFQDFLADIDRADGITAIDSLRVRLGQKLNALGYDLSRGDIGILTKMVEEAPAQKKTSN